MFGVAAIANKFAILYLGHAFAVVGNLLMIESIAALFIAWDNALGQQYLLPTNQTGKYTRAVIVGAVVNIVFNIPLILKFGVIGSMWATVLSEVAVTVVMLWQVRKEFVIKDLFGDFPKIFIAGTVMFVIIWFIDGYMSISWFSMSVEILLGVVIYTCLILILKPRILCQRNFFKNNEY